MADAKRYREAQALLEHAVHIAPRVATSYQFIANVAFLSGDRQGAADALEEALRRDPQNPVVRRNLKALREGR
jgi:Tfp pilus assembly protein PilF